MKDDSISRQAAIDAARDWYEGLICGSFKGLEKRLRALPSAQPERKPGKWLEKTVFENPKAAVIEEWQSCKCSVCGRYDTRPYSYYFDEPHYCSWCGADMRGEQDDRRTVNGR